MLSLFLSLYSDEKNILLGNWFDILVLFSIGKMCLLLKISLKI